MKAVDEAMAVEGEGLVGADAKAMGTPIDRSSIELTPKTSNDASTQTSYNI